MWLPTPFYEKAPLYWLFLGLFLIVIGTYLGVQVDRTYLYLGVAVGMACCAWSVRTYWQRSFNREHAAQGTEAESFEQG